MSPGASCQISRKTDSIFTKISLDFFCSLLYNVSLETVCIATSFGKERESAVDSGMIQRLRLLHCAMRRRFERSAFKQEIDHITGTHGWVLGFLAERDGTDIYQRDLEKTLGLSRSATSKLLALMEQNGLVRRVRVASDDRLKKIVLTDKARQYTAQAAEDLRQTEQILTAGFTPEELSQLRTYLDRMQENLDGKSASGKEQP